MNLLETALQHHRGGELAEAARLYREVLAREPNHAGAAFLLGVVALESGQSREAVDLFGRAVTLAPDIAAYHANLGEAQRRSRLVLPAVDSFLKAIALGPRLAAPAYNLALLLQERGAVDGAMAWFRRAAELDGNLPEVQTKLAALRATTRGSGGPARSCDVAEDPDALSATTLSALGGIWASEGRNDEATAVLRRAVELAPGLAAAHSNLGAALAGAGQIDEAVACYRRALEIQPGLPESYHNLGNALYRGGRLDEALRAFRGAVEVKPEDARYLSNLIFCMQFHPATDARAILTEVRAWDQRHGAPLVAHWVDRERDRDPQRRLRIGYLSPNFRRHCQALFLFPLLAHHDHERFEIFCYSDVARPDDWTTSLLGHADVTRNIVPLGDAAVTDRIREDGIDVLVDLTMHMADRRLLVFARKPAPVQVCWLAYPGTTGLRAIDYRITDPYLDPPGCAEDAYTETSVRLPDTFWCYDPLTSEETVSPLPARRNGHIQFGSLNNFYKVNDAVIALWARVMREVEGSRLKLLAPLGDARQRALDAFESLGVDGGRIEFADLQSRLPYLATYRSIDVCLDTFPYNGHTTSLDAFWMGVPVVTLVGSRVVGRAGLCQVMNLGLPELVAHTPDEYVQAAVALCQDVDRLSDLRAGLRTRMERSPLMDAPRFAKNLEAAYRDMWRRWCGRDP